MITGVVVFICIISMLVFLYAGYIVGVWYTAGKIAEACVEAMIDFGLDADSVKKIINRTIEITKLNKKKS